MTIRVFSALFLVALLPGCAALGLGDDDDKDVTVTYAAEVLENYRNGMEELWDENYLEARKFMEHVRNNFQFSKYAVLAELRLADADFGRSKYAEAFDGYTLFRKFHPNHPAAGYAAYKAALSFYEEMPSNWFFMPPPEERDQAPIRRAAQYFQRYVEEYGAMADLPEGQQKVAPDAEGEWDIMVGEEQRFSEADRLASANSKLSEVRRRLADHEMYVAEFYLRVDKPKAAVARLEGLLDKFNGVGLDIEALELLAETYLDMEDKPKARRTYERLLADFPGDPAAEDAREFLQENP